MPLLTAPILYKKFSSSRSAQAWLGVNAAYEYDSCECCYNRKRPYPYFQAQAFLSTCLLHHSALPEPRPLYSDNRFRHCAYKSQRGGINVNRLIGALRTGYLNYNNSFAIRYFRLNIFFSKNVQTYLVRVVYYLSEFLD